MARRDAVVQPHQFDPESDPEGVAPEEIQTLWLQQEISEWLVCLNNVCSYVLLQLLPAVFVSNTVSKLLDTVRTVSVSNLHISRLFTVTTKLHRNIINIKLASNAIA